MSNVVVKPVESSRERRQFLKLPWQLYRDDPNWIPPLRANQKELVGYRRHPFYEENEVQTFLALRGGQPCGRIAAIVNQGHIRKYDERRGFFGFFESVDDNEVSAGLFDAARDWLARRDIHLVRGPQNPSLNYESALLIDGFEHPPMFMMTYNPPYYERLIEDYGFRKAQDLYAYWGHAGMLKTLDKKMFAITAEAKRRFGVTVRRMDRSKYAAEVKLFLTVFDRSFEGTWGYVPLTDREIDHQAAGLKHLVVPEMTTIAEIDGKPVGAVLGLLDYNSRIKKIDGRLYPFGFVRLLWNRRAIKRVRFLAANVVPEYQLWGLGLVLLDRLIDDAEAWGIEEAEFSWVMESNRLSRTSLERGGAKRQKTYRIYDYEPSRAAEEANR